MAHENSETDSSYHREKEGPIPLKKNSSGWYINFLREARAAGIEGGDYVTVELEDAQQDPLVLIGLLPEPPENPQSNPLVRKVSDRGSTLSVKIPRKHLEEHGLDIDPDNYDTENRLLFDYLVDDGVVGLFPLGFEDGTEFVPTAVRDDEDPAVDATPDPEQSEQTTLANVEESGTPVSEQAITTAAQTTGVNREKIVGALERIDESVARDDLELVENVDPLETDDATVYLVTDESWAGLVDDLGLSEDVAVAVEQAETIAAEELSRDAGASEFMTAIGAGRVVVLRA